ncbi:MAG TPA: M23 family metallopeptidase [Bacteroidia bacterium]|nr:M23 family metallopeptidase [Bacteroidia bacterium]
MSEPEKKKRFEFLNQFKNKYRLVIMNDDTFEEKASFVLSPRSVFVFIVSSTLFLIIGVTYLIAFTSLREYIPGYADVNMRRNVVKLSYKSDSLTNEIAARDLYLENLKAVLSGNIKDSINPKALRDTSKKFERIDIKPSEEDLALRKQIEEEEKNSLRFNEKNAVKSGINSFFFFVPIKGIVTNKFKVTPDHYGVDVVAQRNEAIKAVLDGTVVLSDWTPETGHVIQLQHDDNIISIYKHNSVLLKKAGERVKAGEPIAIIGESGELSTGPHLHFELWYKGKALDPQEYMSF